MNLGVKPMLPIQMKLVFYDVPVLPINQIISFSLPNHRTTIINSLIRKRQWTRVRTHFLSIWLSTLRKISPQEISEVRSFRVLFSFPIFWVDRLAAFSIFTWAEIWSLSGKISQGTEKFMGERNKTYFHKTHWVKIFISGNLRMEICNHYWCTHVTKSL